MNDSIFEEGAQAMADREKGLSGIRDSADKTLRAITENVPADQGGAIGGEQPRRRHDKRPPVRDSLHI